jgi:cell division protein FtsB
MRKKSLLLLFLSLLLILGFLTFFGNKGILHLLRLQKELARIKEMNVKMEEENRKLREEVRRLQYEKRYIEEIARKELGLVKEGEIIYQFDSPGDKSKSGNK